MSVTVDAKLFELMIKSKIDALIKIYAKNDISDLTQVHATKSIKSRASL